MGRGGRRWLNHDRERGDKQGGESVRSGTLAGGAGGGLLGHGGTETRDGGQTTASY